MYHDVYQETNEAQNSLTLMLKDMFTLLVIPGVEAQTGSALA